MSDDDRRVSKRSDRQVREAASRTKDFYGLANRRPVNIIACLESGKVLTDQGQKRLIYRVLEDREMEGLDGKTEFGADEITISVKRSVHESARFGDGRSRMTLAHELGHAVMHIGAPKFRTTAATGATSFSKTNAYESAEHQAKVFAAAFLIHDKQAIELDNAEAISEEFCVSLEAARIALERLHAEREHAESVVRVQARNAEFQALFRTKQAPPRYLNEPCIGCGEVMLLPIGLKIQCQSCDRIFDRQDGD